MTPFEYTRLRELYVEVAQLARAQRDGRLAGLRADEPRVAAELECLLARSDEDTRFLREPALDEAALERLAALVAAPPGAATDAWPERIAHFRIVRRIGSGGMGTVYEARQTRPERTVALKVIREELVSRALLRRFELEIQLLGRLHHPGIARIHEAGVFEGDGTRQAFYAMEYVAGLALCEHARIHALSTRARLRLFVKLCDAVQHAHLNGVVHRDLKPSNVLVDEHGDPKIVDFGVARALDDERRESTHARLTQPGQIVGTVAYMSPEQAAGDADSVDARSDIYALGVLLYELLAGRTPFDLGGCNLAQAARVVAEREPPRLSRLDARLRGDLDAIAAKALEKDRAARYQSAGELAADVRRHLAHEPVVARRIGPLQRWVRYARRNRLRVGAAAAVLLTLVFGAAATRWQAVQASAAREAALTAAARKATALEFLRGVLGSASPRATARPDITMREVLTLAGARARGELARQPDMQADVLDAIGTTYFDLGLWAEAERDLADAVRLRELALGAEHVDTSTALLHLARVHLGRADHAAALESFERARRGFAAQHDDRRGALADCDLGRALALCGMCRAGEARALFETALATRRELAAGRDDDELVLALRYFANYLLDESELDGAERTFGEAYEMSRRLHGEHSVDAAIVLAQHATTTVRRGRYDECADELRRAAEIEDELLEPAHPLRLQLLEQQIDLLGLQQRRVDAIALCRDALELVDRRYGANAAIGAQLRVQRALHCADAERFDEAEQLYREAFASAGGSQHSSAWRIMLGSRLAGIQWARGDYAAAESGMRAALADAVACFGPTDLRTAWNENSLAVCLRDAGQLAESEQRFLRLRAADLSAASPDRRFATALAINLARLYERSGDLARAWELCAESAASRRALFGDRAPAVAETLVLQGRLLTAGGDLVGAEASLREAISIYVDVFGAAHSLVADARAALADVMIALGRTDEANALLSDALDVLCSVRGERSALTLRALATRAALGRAQVGIDTPSRTIEASAATTVTDAQRSSSR